jgi:1-deoxy-D-xylulose-5-phosphate reductoisomerase
MEFVRQTVCILGSTGSIGCNTLEVIAQHPERFSVFALSAYHKREELKAQCLRFRPRYALLHDVQNAAQLQTDLKACGVSTEVLSGALALADIAAHTDVDIVMAAIVGAAGLRPCLSAARAGKRLLLANKEALVVGGSLFLEAVRQGGATLLPIDSEHSAIFQCLPEDPTTWPRRIDHIVLTASGGPFRERDPQTLQDVTPEQACAHPNWVMGQKISVDSATMMNKALEVIEARWLFNLQPEQIRVVIHPQSIVHSMVVYQDASVVAQLGTPDMRVPIAYGLSYPERIASGASALDLTQGGGLTFERPDPKRFPALELAWESLRGRPGSTAVLNAANEIAVEAFLEKRLRFDRIPILNAQVMQHCVPNTSDAESLEDLLDLDARARRMAKQWMERLQ